MSNQSDPQFSFTWQALKLLGKSLYSNPWAAISELVANGFDAGAETVQVLLDLSKGNGNATLEVLDDGHGMDEDGIKNYVQVGRNKRKDVSSQSVTHPMGRKGIGKLAALYLSDEYLISTRHEQGSSTWLLRIDPTVDENDHPRLARTDPQQDFRLGDQWDGMPQGTILSIRNIDLKGTGEAALDALGTRLANQFLLSSMNSRQILLGVKHSPNEVVKLYPVEKQVAFKNFMFAYDKFPVAENRPVEISKLADRTVKIKVGSSVHALPVATGSLESLITQGSQYPLNGTLAMPGVEQPVSYSLTGWLGVHATIDATLAKENDPRFTKNRFYNPSQIRLYVRNKLASENVLQMLGITQAYANYIEGEVSFDVLDDDLLPDIATTNRQGFDENDPRILRLQEILKPLVQSLIRQRETTMTTLKATEKATEDDRQKRANNAFLKEVKAEMTSADISQRTAEELLIPISNKLTSTGATAKGIHRVFLSHASPDKDILDVIYFALLELGAKDDEIFYTSRDQQPGNPDEMEQLTKMMHQWITDTKTRILYVTTPAFNASMFCLFEGGAGWATRGVGDFDLLTTRYEHAPVFLHNSQPIQGFVNNAGVIELTQNVYVAIVRAINNLVEHLNSGREIQGASERITLLNTASFPPPHEQTDPITSYMDDLIVRLWEYYVKTTKASDRY